MINFVAGEVLYAANLNEAFSTGIANVDWTFTNTITFSNTTNFTYSVNATGNVSISNTVYVNGTLTVDGNVSVNGTLSVTGNTTFNSNVFANSDVRFNANVYIANNASYLVFRDGTFMNTAFVNSPRYDIGFSYEDRALANEVVARYVFPRPVMMPAGALGSVARCEQNAYGVHIMSIRKNNVAFCNLTWTSSSNVGSFSGMGSDLTFNTGDMLTIVAANTFDNTLSRVSITLSNFLIL